MPSVIMLLNYALCVCVCVRFSKKGARCSPIASDSQMKEVDWTLRDTMPLTLYYLFRISFPQNLFFFAYKALARSRLCWRLTVLYNSTHKEMFAEETPRSAYPVHIAGPMFDILYAFPG